ncbi:MAG: hypothetical protein M3Y79_01090 [Pseudomonadota bacterium]|nr:hypothetical protein [Pseudomonadota bacterium]
MKTEQLPARGLHCLAAMPDVSARCALIVLHGYGMDAADLLPLAQAMKLPAALYAPLAPHPVENRGRSWWHVDPVQRQARMDLGPRDLSAELPAGRELARELISSLMAELSSRHEGLPLFMLGFSQGGMLACDVVLHSRQAVAGLFLHSSCRIAASEWEPRLARLRGMPVIVSHGRQDSDLAFHAGEQLRDALERGGAQVKWLPFDGGHEIPFTVWREVRRAVLDELARR